MTAKGSISNAQARWIADQWTTWMYPYTVPNLKQFWENGSIERVDDLTDEIERCLAVVDENPEDYTYGEFRGLTGLLTYVKQNGPRDEFAGWTDL
jgi:hypothetical protein